MRYSVIKTLLILLSLLMMSAAVLAECQQQECWALQIGSYRLHANAKHQLDRLSTQFSHRVSLTPYRRHDVTLYVVRIEQLSFAQMSSIKAQLKQQGYRILPIKKSYPAPSLHNPVNVTLPTARTFLHLESVPRQEPKAAEIKIKGKSLKPIDKVKTLHLAERDAVLLALRYNPQVKNAEIDRILQKYHLQQAARNFQWQYRLSASTSYTTSKFDGTKLKDSESYQVNPSASRKTLLGSTIDISLPQTWPPRGHQPSAQITLTQPLLRGLNREIIEKGVNDALDNERVNRLQLKRQIMDVVASVLKAYRSLIQANNSVAIAEKSLHEAEKTYRNNAVQIRLGKIAKTVNISQKSQIASLKLRLLRAKNQRDQTRQNLLSLLGLDPDLKIQVPKNVDISHWQQPGLEEAIDQGIAHNISYQSQLISYKKNKRALAKARDDMRWKLDFNASLNLGNPGAPGIGFPKVSNGKNYSQTVGLSLDVPIDDLDLKVGLASANIQLRKDAVNLYQAQRELISRVKNAITDLTSTSLQLEMAQQTVSLKQQVYDVYQVKLSLGKGSDLDALEAQNALIDAQDSLINTKISFLNAITDLHVLLGSLLDEWKITIDY